MKTILLITCGLLFAINVNSQVAREWATYYSGTTSSQEWGYTTTTDASGNVYMAGATSSTAGIAFGGHQNTYGGGSTDAFLVKFDSLGNRLWATYYGGGGIDYGRNIITDAAGNIYMVGYTNSLTGISSVGFQNTIGGGYDAFLVKFNSAGVRQWATYYGGTADDWGYNLCLDASGNIFLAGAAESAASIAAGGFDNTFGGSRDAYLVKFDVNGNRIWATYCGGTTFDEGHGVDTDASGNIYLGGWTQSTNTIASGGFQNIYQGNQDAFLIKYNSAGVRQWGTYYGGTGLDDGKSVSCDASGNVYLCGFSASTTGIASSGFQNVHGGGTNDAYLVKFNSAGTRLWGTYYGGSGNEDDADLCIDGTGNLFLNGVTTSTIGIASNGFQNTYGGGTRDGFLVRFDNNGNRLAATYYGGPNSDFAYGVCTDPRGNIYLSGLTFSSVDIAIGGFQNIYTGAGDAFLVKFASCFLVPSIPGTISGTVTICSGTTNTYSINTVAGATSYNWSLPGGWTGTSTTNSITTNASSASGNVSVASNNSCGSSSATTLSITVNTAPTILGSIAGNTNVCSGSSNTYSVINDPTANSYTWMVPSGWSGNSTNNSITAIAGSTSGTISITANNTCGSSTATLSVNASAIPSAPASISGTTTICANSIGSYSITPIAGATNYSWVLPLGWTGTSSTNSIIVTTSSNTGNISVTANNTCGSSLPSTLAININNVPSTPGSISGLTSICNGSTNSYSITTVAGAISYNWSLPGGWSGTSTTNSITTNASSTSGNIIVNASNACGNSPSTTLAITVNSAPSNPSSISGTTTICDGSTNTYSVPTVSNATSYTWILPSGWSGSSITNSITATSDNTSGSISVTANNTCGSSSTSTLLVTVNSIPATPTTIFGTTSICQGSGNNYSVTVVSGATSYSWILPSGWVGTSATNSISTTANSTSGNVEVTAQNNCGNSSPAILAITVNALPAVNLTLANDTICLNTSIVLSGGTPAGGSYSGTGVSSGNFNSSIAGTGNHVITYSFTDGNSCTNTSTASIVVDICLGLEKQNSINEIQMYPSPTSGVFTLFCSNLTNSTITIYNILGETIYSVQTSSSNNQFDLSEFNKGVYFVQIKSGNQNIVKKIVKE